MNLNCFVTGVKRRQLECKVVLWYGKDGNTVDLMCCYSDVEM